MFSLKLHSLLLLLYLSLYVTALTNLQHANLDFNLLGGRISLFGDFDGVSFYNTANASAFLTPPPLGSVGFYIRNTTTSDISTAATLDGLVSQALQLTNDSVLLVGNFTHINKTPVQSPVVYNVTTGQFSSIWPLALKRDDQIKGNVLTALVDGELVYFGGDFSFNNTNGVAVYNSRTKALQSTPFLGFGPDSVVNSIAKYSGNSANPGSIVFGGKFNTLGFPQLLMHNVTYNVTLDNTTNSTNTSLISAEQLVLLKHAIFSNLNGAPGNNDASLICPSLATTWSALDGSGAEWAVELPDAMKGLSPTKVRIYLPDDASDGIKTFRIYTYPNNGIMNLTYVDPATNTLAYCDAWCPLLQSNSLKNITETNKLNSSSLNKNNSVFVNNDGSLSMYYYPGLSSRNLGYGSNYQEFALVNQLTIDKVGLTALAWYGSKAEFAGIELYQDQIRVYANNTFNEPNCGSASNGVGNSVQINNGSWQSIKQLNSAVTTKDYLVSAVQDSSASLTFYPNISYSGVYSILLYTPGCALDGSCDKRSIINATVISANGTTVSSQQIYQNNLEDKFDYLFFGHFNASSSSRQNRIRLDYVSPVNPSVQDPWMVADKAVANIVELDTYFVKNLTNSTNSTNTSKSFILKMSLNGLFEYSLANFSSFDPTLVYSISGNSTIVAKTNTFVGNSTINSLSANLSLTSSIDQVFVNGNSLQLLGTFSSPNVTLQNSNLISMSLDGYNSTLNETLAKVQGISKRDSQQILGFTFNNTITSVFPYGNASILLGQFSISSGTIKNLAAGNATTETASNVALYQDGQLYSFGNPFYNINFSQFTQIYIDGTEYFVFADEDGSYITWDNSQKSWLSQANVLDITNSLTLNDAQIVIGSNFVSMPGNSRDQAFFSNNSVIQSYSFNLSSGAIRTSYYVNSTFAVIGGKFTSNLSSPNVAVIQNNTLTEIYKGATWDNNSVVSALFVDPDDEFLYVGSNGSVKTGNLPVTGVSVYSLRNLTLSLVQPPDLSTYNGSAISVNALALYEENKQLLVGGRFDRAGSLDCNVVCIYDTVNTRWLNPQTGSNTVALSGTVTDAKFFSSEIALLSGDLVFNGTKTNFLTYNFASSLFALPPNEFMATGVSDKHVTKFIINDNSNAQLKSRMVAKGNDFVIGFNGTGWSRIDAAIDYSNTTKLTDLKLVQLASKSSNNSNQTYFNSDKALMLSGVFSLKGYGVVNLAVFDGNSWSPYVFTLNSSKIGLVSSISFQDIYRLQSSNDIKSTLKHLSVGQVVGISLACALGSTAFVGLLYIIPLFFLLRESKKREAMRKRISEDDMMNIVDPGDLFHEMDLQRNY